jgi:molybdopterin synthase catalytic subunit
MIRIQTDDFDLSHEYAALRADSPAIGAIVTFTGLVRDMNEGDSVQRLWLEHYPGMTEQVLAELGENALQRFNLQALRIIHRVGELGPGDQIVFVGTSSAHRGDAFAACEFLMDFLKTRAPFWKKELTPDGDRWLDARSSDTDAAARWRDHREPQS